MTCRSWLQHMELQSGIGISGSGSWQYVQLFEMVGSPTQVCHHPPQPGGGLGGTQGLGAEAQHGRRRARVDEATADEAGLDEVGRGASSLRGPRVFVVVVLVFVTQVGRCEVVREDKAPRQTLDDV